MATLPGLKIGTELKSKGWEYAENPADVGKPEDEKIYGDPYMRDPVSGRVFYVWAAAEIQDNRENKKFGYYSAKADVISGHAIWLDENFKEVKITAAYTRDGDKTYNFDDKIDVGNILLFVRSSARMKL